MTERFITLDVQINTLLNTLYNQKHFVRHYSSIISALQIFSKIALVQTTCS